MARHGTAIAGAALSLGAAAILVVFALCADVFGGAAASAVSAACPVVGDAAGAALLLTLVAAAELTAVQKRGEGNGGEGWGDGRGGDEELEEGHCVGVDRWY